MRILQLSAGEAASRVRAAAAVGPRNSMLGERLDPRLPRLAALQREGVVSTEKVAIVERAMHKLSRPDLVERSSGPLSDNVASAAVGPVTAEPLRESGINPVIPDHYRLGALVVW